MKCAFLSLTTFIESDRFNDIKLFAARAAQILLDISDDLSVDPDTVNEVLALPSSDGFPVPQLSHIRSTTDASLGQIATLQFSVTRDLWQATRRVVPASSLGDAAEVMIAGLLKRYADLDENDLDEEFSPARKYWACLCAEVLCAGADVSNVREFWKDWAVKQRPSVIQVLWTSFAEVWRDNRQACWESAAVLLAVPFGYVVLRNDY